MFDRFTNRSKKVMNFARIEAQRLHHEYLGTEHILLGLVQEGSGAAVHVLRDALGIDLVRIRSEVEEIVKSGPSTIIPDRLPFTPRAKRVLELAMEEAFNLGHRYIGTEHLLLGLIKEGQGIAAQVLSALGVTLERARDEVVQLLERVPGDDAQLAALLAERKNSVVPSYGSREASGSKPASGGSGPAVVGGSGREPNVFERFTDRCKHVFDLARRESQRLNHDSLGAEHALLGLTRVERSMAQHVIESLGVELRTIRDELEKLVHAGPVRAAAIERLPFTAGGKKVIEHAMTESMDLAHTYIGTEHVLLGLTRDESSSAGGVLRTLGLTPERVRQQLVDVLAPAHPDDERLARLLAERARRRT